ncbi:MAG TPA: serpin family protein [Dehalococcoidia bacterium]|nr:serpin family protein [Dehalococcoidia bacterium]
MKKLILSLMMMGVLLATTSCSQMVSGDELKSGKPYDTSPDVSATDLETLVNGNTDFAFDLYRQLNEKNDGNLFYSPYSLSLALAMTYAGAEGETEQQMAEVLHFILEDEDLHAAFNKLALELASRGEGADGKDDEGFRLNIVNAIWGQQDYEFLSEFLDVLAKNYDAGLRILDFINKPEESRITINDWVSDQTEGRIEDLIKEGVINSLTRLVLTNSIYFNAAWKYPFDEENTYDDTFYLLDGSEITVEMMHQTEEFGYAEGDGYQAVELKYDGDELSMIILLPEEGNFEAFESALDAQMLEGVISGMETANVTLAMPKFEYDSEFSLKAALEAMGMPVAFSMDADFSGMTGNADLFIKDVVHKAFVSVDEVGTEAAAASAVIMELKAVPGEPVEVTIDQPFIYLIQDIQTGAILFIGSVVNPGA